MKDLGRLEDRKEANWLGQNEWGRMTGWAFGELHRSEIMQALARWSGKEAGFCPGMFSTKQRDFCV